MIIMYLEGGLTDPDSTFYCLPKSKGLELHTLEDDLGFMLRGSLEQSLKLLQTYHEIGFLDFNGGTTYKPEDSLEAHMLRFIEFFSGKLIKLKGECLAWLSVDLSGLFSECEKITYKDIDAVFSILDARLSYPEYFLDTGEFLEEKVPHFFIGDVGVFSATRQYYQNKEHIIQGVGRLFTRFLKIERLLHISEIMSSDIIETKYKEYLDTLMGDGLENHISSWELIKASSVGKSGFQSRLDRYRDPKNILDEFLKIYIDNNFSVTGRNITSESYYKNLRLKLVKNPNDIPWIHEAVELYFTTNPVPPLFAATGPEFWDRYVIQPMRDNYKVISETETTCVVDICLYLNFIWS